MLAIVCPGQGAQSPKFLSPWIENPDNRALLETFSDIVRLDLVKHGKDSDEETIKNTVVSQPLIVSAGILAAQALQKQYARSSTSPFVEIYSGCIFTGHSVGEITAAALSKALNIDDALRFVALRAQAMAAASAKEPTGMTALLGGNRDDVLDAIRKAGAMPSNINGPQQVVASGSLKSLKNLANDPPANTRIVPLKVSGAFHTKYMASAQGPLRKFAATLTPHTPKAPVVSNKDGRILRDGRAILNSLVDQITQPVQWQACMEKMVSAGVTGLLELVPAGTLTGLAKRSIPTVTTFALKTPEQLNEAAAFVKEHSRASKG